MQMQKMPTVQLVWTVCAERMENFAHQSVMVEET
jgi:hypothetical protein